MTRRAFIFRQRDRPDEVVKVTTRYLEAPGRIEHRGALWVRDCNEKGRPVFRPVNGHATPER